MMLQRAYQRSIIRCGATRALSIGGPLASKHAVPQKDASKDVPFTYQPLFENAVSDATPYRRLDDASEHVTVEQFGDRNIVKVGREALRILSRTAMSDIAHLLRPGHLQQLSNILNDPEASENDRFVAMQLLRNANIASGFVLPGCQDTGTAIMMGKRGAYILTDGDDEAALAQGVYDTYTSTNLRYSQVAPLDMFTEKNTGTNLPAQIDLYATSGSEYSFHFMAKGGGSANKTFLFQQTKALLNPDSLRAFLEANIKTIGTAACPPYHLALCVGGLSAELCLKTVKLASARYLDNLPTSGNEHGRAFRDTELEAEILQLTRDMGIGAQFGGKYFCHDIRVIRLPRHGASCPVGLGVSCSADRQCKAKINKDGVFIEALEREPARFLPEVSSDDLESSKVVNIDLNRPMADVLAELTQHPVRTRLSLSGTLIVARDIAHAKIQERLNAGLGMPQYLRDHPVYYAGPAKTPDGMASAGRMDSYVSNFQAAGGSMVMLAKGNRSPIVTKACKKYGGFYLGSIGGPAAVLASEAIKSVEVEDFPAFIVVDDKGNDFFSEWMG